MATLKFTPLAESDLEAIWEYIAEQDADTATGFVDDLVQKCGLLAQHSGLGRARPELLINLRSFSHRRYVIFYFGVNDGVEIYRILHSARDIEEVFEGFIGGLPSAEEE